MLEPNLHIDIENGVNNPSLDVEMENSLKSRLWRDLLAFSLRSTVRRRFVMCRNLLMIVSLCFRFRSEVKNFRMFFV